MSNQMVEVISIQKVKTFRVFFLFFKYVGDGWGSGFNQKGCFEKSSHTDLHRYRNDVLAII